MITENKGNVDERLCLSKGKSKSTETGSFTYELRNLYVLGLCGSFVIKDKFLNRRYRSIHRTPSLTLNLSS